MRICLFALLLSTVVQSSLSDDAHDYLLPGDMLPTHYNIKLVTRIQDFVAGRPETFLFDGYVDIYLTAIQNNIKQVVVNAFELNITDSRLFYLDTGVDIKMVNNRPQPDNFQKLTFELANGSLNIGDNCVLGIRFKGTHDRESPVGFYYGQYGDDRFYLATQFAQIHARKAFPCYDEPKYRATFNISVSVSKSLTNYSVLSNSNQLGLSTDDPDNEGYNVFTFKQTSIPISSYLVGIVVSDFIPTEPAYFKSDYELENMNKTFTTWGQSGKINAGAGEMSQLVGPAALQYYTQLFDIGYALKKVDQVGVNRFLYSAMENYGLILFVENTLFSSVAESGAQVIIHELGHQWFGNLVAIHWWSDYWLKEGFATFFQHFAAGHILTNSTTDFTGMFLVNILQGVALSIDSYNTSVPMTYVAYKPEELPLLVSPITYDKGSSVLRMVNHILGDDVFYSGLRIYLKERQQSIAYPEDLTRAWDKAVEEAELRPNLGNMSVEEMFRNWHILPGYPLVTATRIDSQNVTLTQERFLVSEGREKASGSWNVPLSYTTDVNPQFDTRPVSWLTTNQDVTIITIDPSSSWYIVNNQETGYYRVNYDSENWRTLSETLYNVMTYKKIHVYNRAQLIDDSWTLCESGYISCTVPLNLSLYIQHEDNPIPVMSLQLHQRPTIRRLYGQDGYQSLKTYLLNIYKQKFLERRFNDTTASQVLCELDYQPCVETAQQLFNQDHRGLSETQRKIIYCSVIQHGSTQLWNQLWQKYQTSDDTSTQEVIISSLGCTTERATVKKFLEASIESNSSVVERDRYKILISVVQGHPDNIDAAVRFLVENVKLVSKRYQGFKQLSSAIEEVAKNSNKAEYYDLMVKALNVLETDTDMELRTISQLFKNGLEIIKHNLYWQDNIKSFVVDWLNHFASSGKNLR